MASGTETSTEAGWGWWILRNLGALLGWYCDPERSPDISEPVSQMSGSSCLASPWSPWSLVRTLDEGQSPEDSQAGARNEAMHPAPASGAQQRHTHTVLGRVWKDRPGLIHSPGLGSRSLTQASKAPNTFTHTALHTHLLQKPLHYIHTAGHRQGGGRG